MNLLRILIKWILIMGKIEISLDVLKNNRQREPMVYTM